MRNDPYRELLEGFLEGDEEARGAFPLAVLADLTRRVRLRAPDLQEAGLVDDAVSETFVRLLERAPNARIFDPSRGSAMSFLTGYALHAIARVRVQYGCAGVAKHVLRGVLRRDESWAHADVAESIERLPRRDDEFENICSRIDVERALGSVVDAGVRSAIVVLRDGGGSLRAASTVSGIDRRTLRRFLRSWALDAVVADAA
jgi:hypothetical protein